MDRLKRITRKRLLTDAEAAENDAVRAKVEQEFPERKGRFAVKSITNRPIHSKQQHTSRPKIQ